MKNFWKKLPKPFFCLAPMADVTDCAFRKIICKYGKPDVFWTEFVSADGLVHPEALKKLKVDLKYEECERPIVAQIFGANLENIKKAVALCRKLNFDGIDINMGCPDKTIEKQGAGASLIKNISLAKEIIRIAKKEARDLPLSVKTRLGYNKIEIDVWIKSLLEEDIDALTIHLRTRKEKSFVSAHWEVMKEIIEMRNQMGKETLIIGNGDVKNLKDAKEKIKKYNCDGVMLGRAVFGNPWLFANCQRASLTKDFVSKMPFDRSFVEKKLKVMIEHTKLFERKLGKYKNFAIMKKHFKAYANGFSGAKELRVKLMGANNSKEVQKIVKEFFSNYHI